jgi:WhiB family redox-sensing transcriptional regulator
VNDPQHTRADRRWMEHAACAGQYGVMYPVSKLKRNRDHGIAAEEARAKRICATCPVTAECLDYALRHGEKYGVWGGLTPRARRRLTASFPRPAALPRGGPSPDQASPESVGARVGRARSEAAAPDWHLEGSA